MSSTLLVTTRGLEPRISGLKGQRVSQFHYGTKYPRSNAVVCSFSAFDTIATRRPAHFPDFWNFGMMNLYGALHTRLRPLVILYTALRILRFGMLTLFHGLLSNDSRNLTRA